MAEVGTVAQIALPTKAAAMTNQTTTASTISFLPLNERMALASTAVDIIADQLMWGPGEDYGDASELNEFLAQLVNLAGPHTPKLKAAIHGDVETLCWHDHAR